VHTSVARRVVALSGCLVPSVTKGRSDWEMNGGALALGRSVEGRARRRSAPSGPRRWALLLAVLSCLAAPRARATQCRAVDGGTPRLAAIDAETRLGWLDRRLHRAARRATWWSIGWGSLYGGLTVGQLALLPTASSKGETAEKVVGATASFIGVLSVAILPPRVIADTRWWSRHRAAATPDTDPCALLADAEQLLIRDAADDEFGIGPLVHIGNFVINVAAGLVLGLGYDRWAAWSYTTLVGIAIGEIQVITRPTDALNDLAAYRAGELDGSARAERLQWAVAPLLSRGGGGAQLTLRW
jgi:hypothetical protein